MPVAGGRHWPEGPSTDLPLTLAARTAFNKQGLLLYHTVRRQRLSGRLSPSAPLAARPGLTPAGRAPCGAPVAREVAGGEGGPFSGPGGERGRGHPQHNSPVGAGVAFVEADTTIPGGPAFPVFSAFPAWRTMVPAAHDRVSRHARLPRHPGLRACLHPARPGPWRMAFGQNKLYIIILE